MEGYGHSFICDLEWEFKPPSTILWDFILKLESGQMNRIFTVSCF